MDCDRIKDLLPDYHLGHLSPEEEAEVRRHLAEHPECRETLAEVSEVLDLIPASVPPVTPPPELKSRILARIEKEEAPESLASRERRPSAVGASTGERRGRRLALLLASGLGVALLALFALTFAYVGLDRENEALRSEVAELQNESGGSGELQVLTAGGTDLAPEARGTVVADPANGSMALAVYGLPDLPPESDYYVWLIESGGEPVSLGKMSVDENGEGRMTGEMQGPANAYGELEITSQPEDSETHSGEVFLQASLSQ